MMVIVSRLGTICGGYGGRIAPYLGVFGGSVDRNDPFSDGITTKKKITSKLR